MFTAGLSRAQQQSRFSSEKPAYRSAPFLPVSNTAPAETGHFWRSSGVAVEPRTTDQDLGFSRFSGSPKPNLRAGGPEYPERHADRVLEFSSMPSPTIETFPNPRPEREYQIAI